MRDTQRFKKDPFQANENISCIEYIFELPNHAGSAEPHLFTNTPLPKPYYHAKWLLSKI